MHSIKTGQRHLQFCRQSNTPSHLKMLLAHRGPVLSFVVSLRTRDFSYLHAGTDGSYLSQ